MIVYGISLSPYVMKTLAYAAEKNLEVDHRPAMPGADDAEFRAASWFGKVPGFADGDYKLSDSSAIIAYLEAKYPTPALIPAEPQARGKTIWFDEFADTMLVAVGGKLFVNRVISPRFMGKPGDLAAADAAEQHELPPLLAYLEDHLEGHQFLVGDSLTLADIAVAVPFINLLYAGYTVDAATYPRLAAFLARMHARPSIATILARDRQMIGV